jgi:hypothetical protein
MVARFILRPVPFRLLSSVQCRRAFLVQPAAAQGFEYGLS